MLTANIVVLKTQGLLIALVAHSKDKLLINSLGPRGLCSSIPRRYILHPDKGSWCLHHNFGVSCEIFFDSYSKQLLEDLLCVEKTESQRTLCVARGSTLCREN